jgi:4-carboxymuconolactone decarboxylase
LTLEQQQTVDELVAGPRGAVVGPFLATLRSPELTRRLQRLGEYVRYHAAVPEKLRELAILLTAREWRQNFEWQVHAPLAAQAGVSAAAIDAIADGRMPQGMDFDERLIYNACSELHRTHAVTDATYEALLARLGEQGVVDLIALIGYYTTLAMIMNVAQIEGNGPWPD